MVTVTNAVLQASGKIWIPVITMSIGGVIKLVTNWILVGTPAINIAGAPIGTCLCYGTISVLNLVYIWLKIVKYSPLKVFAKPLISAGIMGVFAYLVYKPIVGILGGSLLMSAISLMITIGLSAVLYLLMLIATRALPKEDILMLPKGEKITKLLKM